MSQLLISSFLVSDGSESLRSLTKNERPRAIRSSRSEEMSDCDRIAQVAHQKWANEWIAHSLIFRQKTSDLLGKPMSLFPALEFLHCRIKNEKNHVHTMLLKKNQQCKRIDTFYNFLPKNLKSCLETFGVNKLTLSARQKNFFLCTYMLVFK